MFFNNSGERQNQTLPIGQDEDQTLTLDLAVGKPWWCHQEQFQEGGEDKSLTGVSSRRDGRRGV